MNCLESAIRQMSLIQKCQVQTQKVEVKERVNGNTAWHVYYYNENQIEMFRDRLTQIGIIEQYINFIHCDRFYDLPLVEQTIEN